VEITGINGHNRGYLRRAMAKTSLHELLDHAIQAAFAAGREILAVYGEKQFAIEAKDDLSPLTEADRRAHAAIERSLAPSGLPVLSEEGAHTTPAERQKWDRYWLVDPLDGTKEFIKRNGEFTVNIALMQRDQLPEGPLGAAAPVAGVLYVPVMDRLYFSWKDGGAFRQDKAATMPDIPAYERAAMAVKLPMAKPPAGTYTIVASRSHKSPETEAFIRQKQQEHQQVELTSMGSALKICLVAEGVADVYPRFAPTMEWDTAAGHAICTEAGRQVTDVTTDEPMRYNKYDLMNNWFIVE
jgi:3'(2'), 5'-bisphosphate nucleotidase